MNTKECRGDPQVARDATVDHVQPSGALRLAPAISAQRDALKYSDQVS